MKVKSLFTLFIWLLASSLFAQASAAPSACPSASALQQYGVQHAEFNRDYGWMTFNLHHFDTPEEWLFALLVDTAENKEDALAKANASLANLTFINGPASDPNHPDQYGCLYMANKYIAVTVTPFEGFPTASLFRR